MAETRFVRGCAGGLIKHPFLVLYVHVSQRVKQRTGLQVQCHRTHRARPDGYVGRRDSTRRRQRPVSIWLLARILSGTSLSALPIIFARLLVLWYSAPAIPDTVPYRAQDLIQHPREDEDAEDRFPRRGDEIKKKHRPKEEHHERYEEGADGDLADVDEDLVVRNLIGEDLVGVVGGVVVVRYAERGYSELLEELVDVGWDGG
jgi:hypothetical protein